MDPIVIIAGFILFGMTVYLVGSPLFVKEADPDLDWDLMDEVSAQGTTKDVVFATLAEIEFDYQMGKMSEEDYNELKQRYQPGAIKLLKAEEKAITRGHGATLASEIETELEKELERELAEIRRDAQKGQES